MPSLSADATNLKPTPPDGYIRSVETEFDIRYFNPSSVKEAKPGVYTFVSYAFQTKRKDMLVPGQERAFWQAAEEAHRGWLVASKLDKDADFPDRLAEAVREVARRTRTAAPPA